MISRSLFGRGLGMRPISAARIVSPNMLYTANLRSSSFSSVRYNSTGPPTSEITNKLSQFTEEATKVSDMTSDQLGYLDSIGMAQGYGPTALIERLLEYTHVYTGLPWWGTIVVATIAVRALLFPLYVKASANGAKMAKVKPQLDEIMQKLKHAENPQEQVEATLERKKLLKKHDVHMSHQLFPMIQLPIAYGFFQALRKMASHPVEGFSEQGYGWVQDLTQVDPYLGLQLISSAVVLGMFKLGGETGATQMNPAFKKIMYAIPVVSIIVTKDFYAAVLVYFAVNSMFSFCQTLILRNKYFRRMFKIPAIIVPANGAAAKPQNLGDWWKDFSNDTRASTNKKMQQSNKKLGAMQKRRQDVNKNFIKRH